MNDNKDDVKFRIDGRYIVVLALKMFVGYLAGILIVLYFIKMNDLWGFIGASLCAAITLFLVYYLPRPIYVGNDVISFVEKYGYIRSDVNLSGIVRTETSHKYYNTVTITTTSGEQHQLHPADAEALVRAIRPGKDAEKS